MHRVDRPPRGAQRRLGPRPQRLGMRKEAQLIENEYVKGEWQSEIVYALLDREWRGTTARPG